MSYTIKGAGIIFLYNKYMDFKCIYLIHLYTNLNCVLIGITQLILRHDFSLNKPIYSSHEFLDKDIFVRI